MELAARGNGEEAPVGDETGSYSIFTVQFANFDRMRGKFIAELKFMRSCAPLSQVVILVYYQDLRLTRVVPVRAAQLRDSRAGLSYEILASF